MTSANLFFFGSNEADKIIVLVPVAVSGNLPGLSGFLLSSKMQASGFIEVQICYLFRCNYRRNLKIGDVLCADKQNSLHPGRGQEISCYTQTS